MNKCGTASSFGANDVSTPRGIESPARMVVSRRARADSLDRLHLFVVDGEAIVDEDA